MLFFFVRAFRFARLLVFSVHTFLCSVLVNCLLTFVLVCYVFCISFVLLSYECYVLRLVSFSSVVFARPSSTACFYSVFTASQRICINASHCCHVVV